MLDKNYKKDLAPAQPPRCYYHKKRRGIMRWHDTPLCSECYWARWPLIRAELRAQQLVIGGLPREGE